jgi:hypothetical protein
VPITITITAYTITAHPDDPDDMHAVTVERVSGLNGYTWAVRWLGRTYSHAGQWEWEPQPSNRTRTWLAANRYQNRDDALTQAHKAVTAFAAATRSNL